MHRSLRELEKVIFSEDRTDKEWLEVDREVGEALENATDEERLEFEESGAGDMLGQIIEFM